MSALKRTALPIVTLLGLVGIAGCSSGNAAEETAIKYVKASAVERCDMRSDLDSTDLESCKENASSQQAGDPSNKSDEDYEQPPEVVRSAEWKDGQLVEISYKLAADTPEVHWAYGLVELDGEWKISRYNEIDSDLVGREDAACQTLAENESELSECG